MNNPKISVIVPTYNKEKYIRECLDSVINQTLKPFEIIVCDDASTDKTSEIVMQYVNSCPNLIKTIFHKTNQGIARNFNSGLNVVKGDFVSLVSGDDYWMPKKLEMEFKALTEKKTKWAYSKGKIFHQERDRHLQYWGTVKDLEGDVFMDMIMRNLSPRNFLIEYDALRKVGFFDESLKLYEDWDLKIRLSKVYPIAHVPEILLVYRIHSEGIHKTRQTKHISQVTRLLLKNRYLIRSKCKEDTSRIIFVGFYKLFNSEKCKGINGKIAYYKALLKLKLFI